MRDRSSNTPNLKLFKWNVVADANEDFNIDKALNDNWDKIDEKVNNLDTSSATELSNIKEKNNTQDSRLETLESDNITNKKDISNIKTEQTTQNDNISSLQTDNEQNKNNIEQLQADLNTAQDTLDKLLSGEIDINDEILKNLTKEVDGLKVYKYRLDISQDTELGDTITIPCYYKVGANVLDVYYVGQRLIKCTTNDDLNTGHYSEVGDADSISNQIKITSDWKASTGNYFEFVVRGEYNEA